MLMINIILLKMLNIWELATQNSVTTSPGLLPTALDHRVKVRFYMVWYHIQVCDDDPNTRGGETISITEKKK